MKNQPTRQPTRLLKPLRKNRPPLAHKSPEPMLEPLEPRQLLATITWDGGPDGTGTNLANPVNWSGDVLPGPADDAIISSGGPLLSLAESLAVNTLTSNRELTISGGLAIGNTASISATITLAGGTISGGTWNLTNPVGVNATSTGGTIADANINGTIVVDLTGTQAANLQIEGSTRFLAAKLRGNGSELAFATGYILNDPVIAEGATGGVRLVNFQGAARIGPAGSLAFAAGAFTTIVCVASTQFRNGGTINATAPGTAVRVEAPGFLNTGTITLAQGSIQFGSGTFINEGTFTSQNGLINLAAITNRAQFSLLGTSSAIIGTGIFRNEGTLSITGIPATFGGALTNLGSIALQNANLRLTSTWSSTGTITAQSSTLTLTSDVATSTLNIPGWSLTNTTVRIESILNNAGNILTLTPSSGQWTLAGGTLGGGIVSLASGVVLTALGSPTILNVAVQGTVTVAPSGFLQVRGITTADRILLRGNASVNFFTTEPFEGEIVATEASPARGISFNAPFALGESGRIRIDSTATGTFNILSNSSTAGFTNRGQIIIESPSTTLSVTVPSFTNATTGTITAPAATVINLNTAFSNAGTFNAQNCAITISVPSTQSLFGFTLAGLNIAGSSVTFSGVLVNPSLDFTGRNLTWRFNNATVNGGTIIAPTGQVTFGPNVTLASALLTGDFTVASGGTATFDETDLPQTLRISGGGIAAFASPITITSTIIFGLTGTGAGTLAFDQATTLAPSAQLQLASSSGINISGLGTLTNQTTIDIGGRSLVFDITRVINQGTLRAGPGGAIDLGRSFANTGTIQGNASTITLRGPFTTANVNFASYANPGGNTIIQGQLNNTGSSFEINTSTGNFIVNGTITGGTITFSGGVSTLSIGPSGNLINVNLANPNLSLIIGGSVTLTVTDIAAVTLLPGAVLRFTNAVNIRSGIFTTGGTGNRTVIFDQPSTLAATARVDLTPGTAANSSTVTFARGTTAGTLTSLGSMDLRSGSMVIDLPFTNSGSMNFAPSTNLTISAPWSNPGRIQGENAVYTFAAPFAVTGTWNPQRFTNRGGTVFVRTAVDNTAGTLPLTFESGRWVLQGAIITGGTMTTDGSVYLGITGINSILSNVQVPDAIRIEQGGALTVSGSTRFYSTRLHGTLVLDAGYILRDSVVSVFGVGTLRTAGGGPLLIATGGAIRVTNTFTSSVATFNVFAASITNNGYIGAESANVNVNLAAATFVNNGILGLFGGRITVGGTWNGSAGLGTLQGDPTLSPNSSISMGLGGVLDLGGSTLSLLNSFGQLGLSGGVIRNGTVALASGRSLIVDEGGTLDSARIDGNVRVLAGQLDVRGAASGFASGSLQGSGAINFVNGAVIDMPITASAGGTGFAERVVRLGLGSGITPAGSITMADGGTNQTLRIIVDLAGVEFRGRIFALGRTVIEGQRFINVGTIDMNASVTITATNWANQGTFLIGTGATLDIGGSVTTAGLGLSGWQRSGGTVRITGTINNTGETLTVPVALGPWILTGGTIQGGTLADNGDRFRLTGGGALVDVAALGQLVVDSARVRLGGATRFPSMRVTAVDDLFFGQAVLNFSSGFNLLDPIEFAAVSSNSRRTLWIEGSASIGPTGVIRTLSSLNILGELLVNSGRMESAGAGQTLRIGTNSFQNLGTVATLGGNVLLATNLQAQQGIGNWQRAGGTVGVSGSIVLGPTPATLDQSAGPWEVPLSDPIFSFAQTTLTIVGSGTLRVVGPQTLIVRRAITVSTGSRVEGDVFIAQGGQAVLVNGGSVARIRLGGAGASVLLPSGYVLNDEILGDGTGPGTRTVSVSLGAVTIGQRGSIRTADGMGGSLRLARQDTPNPGVAVLLNSGLIGADGAGSTFSLESITLTNQPSGVVRTIGGTLNVTTTTIVTNLSVATGVLTGGTWIARGGTMLLPAAINSIAAGTTVEIAGGATWSGLSALTSNAGTLRVREGRGLTLVGASFVNSGVLSLGPGAQLSVAGFVQSASGVLETLVGAGGFGRVIATGASLAGTLRVVSVGGWAGGAFSVVVASSRTGTFGTVVVPRPVGGFGGALGPAASVAYSSGGVVVLLPTDPSAVDPGVPSFAGLVSASVGR